MKVVCKENDGYKNCLTINKTYDIINEKKYGYQMINDKGYIWGCSKHCFKLLSEYRNEKINKLLEDESSMYKLYK
jgi:hypothetical protein